jgi:predicted tellurium resistance membrane protein TerC
MMELLLDPAAWIAFLTLVSLEIVLGIDNIVFLAILVAKLPPHQQELGRIIGLSLALLMRIILLLSLSWVMQLTEPLFTVMEAEISGRDLILILGGFFLLAKSTTEIHGAVETGGENEMNATARAPSLPSIIIQIALIDVVFSLDSVITAVGLVDEIPIMIAAVIVAIMVMMLASGPVGRFVHNNPTVKMLALSFLILIGSTLIAEGLGIHFPKGYIYFAMAYALAVEMLNMRLRKNRQRRLKQTAAS